jgi:hypothetical protein
LPGSTPISSIRISRPARYASSASACRPHRYSASISSARSFAQRLGRGELGELGGHLLVPPKPQFQVQAALQRRPPLLVQPDRRISRTIVFRPAVIGIVAVW